MSCRNCCCHNCRCCEAPCRLQQENEKLRNDNRFLEIQDEIRQNVYLEMRIDELQGPPKPPSRATEVGRWLFKVTMTLLYAAGVCISLAEGIWIVAAILLLPISLSWPFIMSNHLEKKRTQKHELEADGD